MSSYKTVLVGTDGSESSFRAVERAAAVAGDVGATLLIASAYTPMPDRDQRRAADALGEESYKVVGAHPAEDILREASTWPRRRARTSSTRWRRPVTPSTRSSPSSTSARSTSV